MPTRRQFIFQATTTMALSVASLKPMAQPNTRWPQKPIKWVIPFAPGGGADIIARLVAQPLASALGVSVLVENRGGASGMIGTEVVAKAPPDGYTWLMSNNASVATAPLVYPNASYDPLKDFTHVTMIGSFANALLVRAEHPAKSLEDFLQLARQKPGSLTYASAGPGSAGHLTGELLKASAMIDIQHVPYKGTGPALVDLASGQIDALFDGLPASMGYIKSGKLRVIAVTSVMRNPTLPNVPTIAESVPGVFGGAWFGISVPSATSKDIVRVIERVAKQVLVSTELRSRLGEIGVVTSGMAEAEFTAYLKSEIARWSPVVKSAKIRAE